MDAATLDRICEIIEEPKAINISGLGEPTLHKHCLGMICKLVDAGIKVQMNTNGRRITQEYYNDLRFAGLSKLVITSDYFPWNKGKLITHPDLPVQLFTITRPPDHPELGQTRKELDDWGGQIGKVDRPSVLCSFLTRDFKQITWNGTIQRCCVDFNANHFLGNIWDDAHLPFTNVLIPLCAGCKGYVFKDGLVAGDYEGKGEAAPQAFIDVKDVK